MTQPVFQFATIYNDSAQLAALQASLLAAGFDEARCDFRVFDNSNGNRFEPFAAFAEAARSSRAHYLVFCHQDVRFDLGHGYERLVEMLAELDERHPTWAVAGNAGITPDHRMVARVRDAGPTPWWSGDLPASVVSLDENFFVVNRVDNARWSPELGGFHFYGTDVCLHALARGRSAHVIDFHLTHIGGGRVAAGFHELHRDLVRRWTQRSRLCLGYAPTGVPILLCRNPLFRRLVVHPAVIVRLMRPRWRRVLQRLLPRMSDRTLRV